MFQLLRREPGFYRRLVQKALPYLGIAPAEDTESK